MHAVLGLLGCRRGTDSAQRGRPRLGLRSQVAPLLGPARCGPQEHVAPAFFGMKSKQGLPKVVGLVLESCPVHPSSKKNPIKMNKNGFFEGATACAL